MQTPPWAHSPAAERNQGPILAVLQALLAPRGNALEIASGTGQHAAHFGAALPGWRWQPTDWQDDLFASISGWCAHSGAQQVLPPLRLDVTQAQWPSEGEPFSTPFDLIYCANMIHMRPGNAVWH